MILDRRGMVMTQRFCRSLVLASLVHGQSVFAGLPDEIRVTGEIPGAARVGV
jgi:hypothetical protein